MFNKNTTASFDVDAQKTFTPLCSGELPVPGGDEITEPLNEQATYARLRVGSKDAHSPEAVWVATEAEPQYSPVANQADSDIHWKAHGVPGTKGFELLDGLPAPMEYDYMVYKGIELNLHPYGACYHTLDWKNNKKSTGVIEYLAYNKIETVIVGGLATEFCAMTTAMQLHDAGFNVIFNLAASRGINQDDVVKAVAQMEAAGIVVVENIATANLFVADTTFGL
jgi:nicotinamidase/pyrazinamidase